MMRTNDWRRVSTPVATYRNEEFAEEIQNALVDLIGIAEMHPEFADDGDPSGVRNFATMGGGVHRVETFEEAMIPGSKGLVITFNDGSQAQLTILAGTPS